MFILRHVSTSCQGIKLLLSLGTTKFELFARENSLVQDRVCTLNIKRLVKDPRNKGKANQLALLYKTERCQNVEFSKDGFIKKCRYLLSGCQILLSTDHTDDNRSESGVHTTVQSLEIIYSP